MKTTTTNLSHRATTVCLVFVATLALAQEDQLPTLKLDRIPATPAFAGQTRAPAAAASLYQVETIASGLSTPWALQFLPDGAVLISEYTGSMRIVQRDGSLSAPLDGLPTLSHEGWAGLFDLTLDPDFANNHRVYFSYTAPPLDAGGANVPRVARARLNRQEHRLDDVEVIIDGFAWQELLFAPDGTLLVSGTGDGESQDLASPSGKLLRIQPDGSVPGNNPVFADKTARPDIFSVGHRDISGIASHPDTGEIWITEHGPRGGDELNRIRPGANYGWEVISYGTNYDGAPVGSGESAQAGMEQPRYFWRPSIAPSGLVFYSGDMFPEWRNNIFVTALSGQHITRLVLDDDRVIGEERLLLDRGRRIRELRVGPDGALYALTNEESDAPKGNAELLRIYRN